jgi:hypothetical protein
MFGLERTRFADKPMLHFHTVQSSLAQTRERRHPFGSRRSLRITSKARNRARRYSEIGGSEPKRESRTLLSGPASGPERGLWTPDRSESRVARRPDGDGSEGIGGSDVLTATIALKAAARNDT